MTLPVKTKLSIAAIPLLLGAFLIYSLNRRESAPPNTPSSLPAGHPPVEGSSGASGLAGTDKLHEKMSLEEQLKKKPGHAPILFRLAEIAREEGKPADAVKHLRELVKQDPTNLEAHLELGRALFETGDAQGAISQTKVILDKKPGDADALYNLGAIYGNSGQNALAKQYFEKAVQSAPDSDSGRKAKAALLQLR